MYRSFSLFSVLSASSLLLLLMLTGCGKEVKCPPRFVNNYHNVESSYRNFEISNARYQREGGPAERLIDVKRLAKNVVSNFDRLVNEDPSIKSCVKDGHTYEVATLDRMVSDAKSHTEAIVANH